MKPTANLRLHRFAFLVAGATLILVVAGASVTSTGSGLAVPDWPLSFGQVFPPMVGGVLYEHGHRMIAGVVLALTAVLAAWLFRSAERPALRRLGLAALLVLIAQAVLGGLTVLFRLPTLISVGHAGLAQIFLCLIVSIALMTSPGWQESPRDRRVVGDATLRRLALATTGVIYLQILLGAFMRHTGAGLAIPDFPLSYGRLFPPYLSPPILLNYAHRIGALVVSVLAILVVVEVLRNHRGSRELTRSAFFLAASLVTQILLGAATIWTLRGVVPTTMHVGMGAVVLASSLVLTLRSHRGLARGHRAETLESQAGMPSTEARGGFASNALGGLSGSGGRS